MKQPSRGMGCPRFAVFRTPLSEEGAGKTGCRLAPAVCCAKAHAENRTAAYRCRRTLGLPCAVG